jgi:hypothetical protein
MTEGPSRREVDRAREAMERHDAELRDDGERDPEEPDEAPEDDDDDE